MDYNTQDFWLNYTDTGLTKSYDDDMNSVFSAFLHNTSNSTDEQFTRRGCLADPTCHLARSVEWSICLVLAFIGMAGNVLSILVLQKQPRRTSNVFLLECLSVVDGLLLLTVFLLSCVFTYELSTFRSCNLTAKLIIALLFDVFQFTSNWLLVQLATYRFIAIRTPFAATRWCSVSKAWRCLVGILAGSVLITVPRAMAFFRGRYKSLHLSYSIISTVFRYVLPIIVLFVLNTKLVMIIRKAKTRTRELTNTKAFRSSVKDKEYARGQKNNDSVTINLIAVLVVFLICGTSRGVYFVLATGFQRYFRSLNVDFLVYNSVSNIMMVFNSASNFFIYCLFYRNFRLCAKYIVCRSKEAFEVMQQSTYNGSRKRPNYMQMSTSGTHV